MLERRLGVRVISAWASSIAICILVSPPVGCEQYNVWTAWSSWSECSFTCGQGVQTRYRECVGHTDHGLVRLTNPTCHGRDKEYLVCKKTPCPVGEEDEREAQCSKHNTDVILGSLYHWIPFYGGPNPCELTCLARGYSFYYNFGSAADGTPCKKNTEDLCVDGHCAKVGCDGLVGSHSVVDDCGVCGGQNANCAFFQRVYDKPLPKTGDFGYNEIVKIPAGATQLKVQDDSNNYLALADARRTYIINGNWVIDWPGRYDVAGTTIYYGRSGADNETITAKGPIKEDLYLMLIFREKNKGVKYQFWIPTDKLSQVKLDLSPASQNSPGRARENSARSRDNLSKEYNPLKNVKKIFHEKSYNRLNAEQKARINKQRKEYDEQQDNGPKYASSVQPKEHSYSSIGDSSKSYSHNSESGKSDSLLNPRHQTEKPVGGYYYPPLSAISDKSQTNGAYREPASDTQAWWEALKQRRRAQDRNVPAPSLGDDSQQPINVWHHRDAERTTYRPFPNHVLPTSTPAPATEKSRTRKKNNNETGNKKAKKSNVLDAEKAFCGTCPKTKNRARHFCLSQFVVRLTVLKIERMGNDTRYDVEIMDKYKDTISLLSREYIWVPNRCNCPRIQRNKEYIVMGSLVTDSLSREGRLQLSRRSFVRSYNRSNNNRLRTLMKRINCDKYG